MLTGEILDCASHRYDAWVTSLATSRLAEMRAIAKPGNQVGAWGAVRGVQRRAAGRGAGVRVGARRHRDRPAGRWLRDGALAAPGECRGRAARGVARSRRRVRRARSRRSRSASTSTAVRRALDLADGMRNGQQLGALLGYLLERGIHDASGTGGVEIDWVVYALRASTRSRSTASTTPAQTSAQRQVADGWKLAQAEIESPAAVVAAVPAPTGAGAPTYGDAGEERAAGGRHDVVATLDALADLGLSESMYQLAGANLERAAAATDMIGRATAPPDVFESAATPRGGRGIEQRLIAVFERRTRGRRDMRATRRAHALRRRRTRSSRAGSAIRAASSCACWTTEARGRRARRSPRSGCRRSTSRRSTCRPRTSRCRASMCRRRSPGAKSQTRGGKASRDC